MPRMCSTMRAAITEETGEDGGRVVGNPARADGLAFLSRLKTGSSSNHLFADGNFDLLKRKYNNEMTVTFLNGYR